MLVSAFHTAKQFHYIHPHFPSPQPSPPHDLPHALHNPLLHKEPIQANNLRNFTLALLMKQVLLHDIVPAGTQCGAEVSAEVCGLAIRAMGVE
jgi:hypothetical protein